MRYPSTSKETPTMAMEVIDISDPNITVEQAMLNELKAIRTILEALLEGISAIGSGGIMGMLGGMFGKKE